MTTHEHSVELAGVNLAGRNHVCAFFNTIDEEHRMLGSFYKDGLDRGEKAAHIVDPEYRQEHLKRLPEAGIHVQEMTIPANWRCSRGPTHMCGTTGSTRMQCSLQSKN